ncbi:carboxypeptidase regulatory-like domain-containing protein [Candidatus Saccharibacteria bacterium]|nr:carboxypeptidase regulatory-like domain-containing protein [Candidatus Saccharibacteria bacterium]NCU40319.1 carboxypeptidase regulatory-like domain-containing protein [Candidatus Saccharibacteria bacterium]
MQKTAILLLGIILLGFTTSTAHAGVESAYFEAPKNIEAGTELKILIRANLSQDEHSSCFAKTTLSYSGNLKLKTATTGNYPSPINFQQNLQNINMTTGECRSAGYTGSYILAYLTFQVLSEGKATITSKAWKNDDIEVNGSVVRLSPIVIDVAPSANTIVGPRFQGITINPYVGAIELAWGSNVTAKDIKLSYTPTDSNSVIEAKVTTLPNNSYSGILGQLEASSSYNFTITGMAEDGTALRYDGYATTKGYPIKIFVQKNNLPVANASIIIDDYTYKTDSEGIYLTNVPPGKADIRIEVDGKTTRQTINVDKKLLQDNGKVADRQDFTITLDSDVTVTEKLNWIPYVVTAVFVLIIIAGAVLGLWFRKRMKSPELPTQPENTESTQPPNPNIES